MCGIVGYVGFRTVSDFLLEGLHRLEYRGYDSAGIAVQHDGEIVPIQTQFPQAPIQQRQLGQPSILGRYELLACTS